jgi:hypothetical protein
MNEAALELSTTTLSAREISDAVWLAAQIATSQPTERSDQAIRPSTPQETEPEPPAPTTPVPPLPDIETEAGAPTSAPADSRQLDPALEPGQRRRDDGPNSPRSRPLLPDLPRGLAKALRPLNRLVASMRDWELDEEETAVTAAESGVWLPVRRAAYEHPFEVVLVVDNGSSMRLWERTASAFQALLTWQGAFTDVKKVSVNTDEISVHSVETVPGVVRSPAQLADPTGRRIVLVLTDGVGKAWRTGSMQRLVSMWARTCRVALIHLLPPERWSWTAIGFESRTVRDTPPGTANVIPVLALEQRYLRRWADLVAGNGEVRLPVLVSATGDATDNDERQNIVPDNERLQRFQATAPPEAVRLAGLLAAAPLTLRVMQVVHGTFLPGSQHWHLAEVLLSGLVRRSPPARDGAASPVEYEFAPGLRSGLLATITREETAHVQRVVEDVLGGKEPAAADLRQVLAAPDDAALPNVTDRNAPLLTVQREVLTALSGPYTPRAKRLHDRLTAHSRYHRKAGATEVGPASSRDAGTPDTSAVAHGTGSRTRRTSSVVPTGSETSSEARSPEKHPRIWGGVPLRNVNFIGRSALLEKLYDEISQSTTTALLPGALHGMGGIGKSLAAVEYVYRNANDYDLVWWIPSENGSEIQASLVKLAQRLELKVEYSGDTAVRAVLDALEDETFPYRWLLVYDNADEPEDAREFWPRGGNGHIIITSRNPQWAEVARPVSVEVFQRVESCELLQRRNPELSDADADRLAAVLGDLPLAIEQAAAWRAETGMSADEYLRLFEDKRTELLATRAPADYDLSVEAAWNVSLDRIRDFNPGALELLEICAFLSPEPISRTIFTGVRNIPASPELEQILADPIELGRAVREINRYSLARIDHRTNTLQLHRLVQLVLRNKLEPDDQVRMQHIAHLLLASRDPREAYVIENWPVYAELLPHVRTVEAHTCEDRWVRHLVINTIIYQYAFGNPSGALVMAKNCATFWSEKLGEKHPDTLTASRWWGRLLRALGRFEEGREVAERTLAYMRETLGDTHEETLLTMHGVASNLRAKGDFHAAREMNEFAYHAAVDRFGSQDDPNTLAAANNYALSLRLAGDIRAALKLDEDTLARKKDVLGEDHRQTLLTMDNWAVDLRETGQYLRARDEQNEVVHRMRAQLGDRHPMTLAATKNLATAHRRAGDHEKVSLALAFEARDGLVSRYGESHPEAMSAVLDLSVGYRQDRNLSEARKLGEHAKALYERNWGPRHPFSLAAATNLAVTLRLLEAIDDARALDERAVEGMREALDADHPFTLLCATNYASDLAESGDQETAYELDRDTYDRSVRVLGKNHPSTLALQVNLALDLRHLNHTIEADTMQADAIQRLRDVLGNTHPATMAAQFNHRADCDIDTLQI